MNSNNQEISLVQNPGIGAFALWRFVNGYYSSEASTVPFTLLFIVLPIVFRSDLQDVIIRTNRGSGLAKFTEKIGNQKNVDQLYAIHHSTEQYKLLSLRSLHIAVATGLVIVESQTAHVIPLTKISKKMDNADAQKIVDAAEKLGYWCSKLTMHEVSSLLKVRF